MLDNLGIALRKQKKLVLIFFLTIFLPALTLGVFGVRAIRNERFRLARQEENEGRRVARFIRSHYESKFEEIARVLEGMVGDPALVRKDHPAICELAENRLSAEPSAGQAFLLYRDEEPSFPRLVIPSPEPSRRSPRAADAPLAARIRRAEALEFVDRNFRAAAAHYRELSTLAEGRNLQAEMLAGQARCLQKAEDYEEAARVYARIATGYPESRTPSGLPLGLLARIQAIDCSGRSGDRRGALKQALGLYRELLRKPSPLGEDQFKTYLSLVGETVDRLLDADKETEADDDFRKEYAGLTKIRLESMREWETAGLLEREVIPELARRLAQSEGPRPAPFRLTKNIEGRDILIMAAWIPNPTGDAAAGMFGVQLDNEYLSGNLLADALGDAQMGEGAEVLLSDLSGLPLSGKKPVSAAPPLVTEYFEGNFPPWKIELFQAPVEGLAILDLRKNFYFWTILTLLVVLAFGAFLIARTIAHEVEILKIKSDFVSSVSHEFKTPLTSIKALMERLIGGKVRDAGKTDQYYAIIAQDTEKLSRLVNNLLDFSKIEEGKREYAFSETDIARIAAAEAERFRKEQGPEGPDLSLEITGEIPALRADGDALSRAVANLLSNAVKFTPPGKAVRAVLRRDGDNVVLEVEDEGIGIHPDELGKVFEKFFQGRNAIDRTSRGTGLGLTLVKHIVEAHGGSVLVESRLGKGSKFTLVLPIKS
jgi:signal transduction histidine kinase/tetratricopeptide (TPR) repeat protein